MSFSLTSSSISSINNHNPQMSRQIKHIMSSCLSSSFFNQKYISTVVLKDKGPQSTEPQTESSQDESTNTVIQILINYIQCLNKQWEERYNLLLDKYNKETLHLKERTEYLIRDNWQLKEKLITLIDGIRKVKEENDKEEAKRTTIFNQVVKENEYLRQMNSVLLIKDNLEAKSPMNVLSRNINKKHSYDSIQRHKSSVSTMIIEEDESLDDIDNLSCASSSTIIDERANNNKIALKIEFTK